MMFLTIISSLIVLSSAIPQKPVNWVTQGVVGPIVNQGACGTNLMFIAVSEIEAVNAMATGKFVFGSAQDLMDCMPNAGGCDGGGSLQDAYEFMATQGGLPTAQCYGPGNPNGNCNPKKCPTNGLKLANYSSELSGQNEQAIYNALANYGPLSIAVDASNWELYEGGIFQASSCTTNVDHYAQIVGYSPQHGGYWIVRNTWGSSWGIDGYIWLQYGANTCGLTTAVEYLKY